MARLDAEVDNFSDPMVDCTESKKRRGGVAAWRRGGVVAWWRGEFRSFGVSQWILYCNAIYAILNAKPCRDWTKNRGNRNPYGQFTSADQMGDCTSKSVNNTSIYTVITFEIYVRNLCA